MAEPTEQTEVYRCPGERYPISRAVHLGRLARFYPGCRQCPHRDDTATLSARQVERLVEVRPRGLPRPLFYAEGAAGVYLNDLTPRVAREMAAALGVALQRRHGLGDTTGSSTLDCVAGSPALGGAASSPALGGTAAGSSALGGTAGSSGSVGSTVRQADRGVDQRKSDGSPTPNVPVVVIAGDGRPPSCELVAAVGEGLRWTGCRLVEIGPATSACLAFAVGRLAASGGVLVGNPGDGPHTVGLKFWAGGPRPLSADGRLERLEQLYRTGVDRPTRRYGPLRRFQAELHYLAGLAGYYHALRPLRFLLHSSCGPLVGYLTKLTEPVACRAIPCRSATDRWAEQILAERAHFAVRIDDDGERCRLYDERGCHVPAGRLLVLLARHLLSELPRRTIVLEKGTPAAVAEAIRAADSRVVFCGARRAEVAAAMQQHGAVLGGGPSGRLWYDVDTVPLPDALRTLTVLLVVLSQSDRPLSEVLDAGVPWP